MARKINSVRFFIARMFALTAGLSTVILFICLQVFIMFFPNTHLTVLSTFVLVSFALLTFTLVGIYIGYQNSQLLKNRLEDISTFIATLTRGKLSERMMMSGSDEIFRISQELNELAIKIQSQVKSLQRLADEKALFAEKAHLAAAVEERQKLARELHDAVSQQLFALSMMSAAALRVISKKPEYARAQLEDIADIAVKAQAEMRALLLHLRPVHLSEDSLKDGVHKLISELQERTNILFQVSIHYEAIISKGTEDHLFRIIQEALSNILRHSEAKHVKLDISQMGNYVCVYIGDDGIGFDSLQNKKAAYGLANMKERCEEIGGMFAIRSKQNDGTYIDIRVPIKEDL